MYDRKHILIVSNACYPELSPRAFRTTELVRELVRRGHRVTLLLPNRETYRRNPLTGDGLQIVYSSSRLEPEKGTPTARRNRKIRSLLPKFAQRAVLYFYCHELRAKYDPGLCERLSELSGPFDAVLSISYPAAVHLAVSRAMRRNAALRSAVTIAEFSDPPFRGDVARTVFPAYFLYLKRWARQFDYFTIPVEKALPCYTPYIDRDRVRIIPQGFDLSTVRRLPYTPHAKPVFAYAGRFYERIRDPKFFFDFLATLDTDFRFDLYVNYLDPCFREMIREAQGRVTGEIALHDPLPREKLIERLSQADFVVNFDNATSNATPSKLIDYAMSGRPILSFNERTFDPEGFHAALSGDYSAQVKGIDLSQYDIRRIADRFEELIDEGKKTK